VEWTVIIVYSRRSGFGGVWYLTLPARLFGFDYAMAGVVFEARRELVIEQDVFGESSDIYKNSLDHGV
jgi:hypothetical protein